MLGLGGQVVAGVGGDDLVIDVEVAALVGAGQERGVLCQGDQERGGHGVELADVPERERPQERAQRGGVRLPVNDRLIPPWRNTPMSSMPSAPATIPATSVGTPGRPDALLRPAPLRTGLARFPRIRLKQAPKGSLAGQKC
jgi:hypothetical protein